MLPTYGFQNKILNDSVIGKRVIFKVTIRVKTKTRISLTGSSSTGLDRDGFLLSSFVSLRGRIFASHTSSLGSLGSHVCDRGRRPAMSLAAWFLPLQQTAHSTQLTGLSKTSGVHEYFMNCKLKMVIFL